MSRPILAEYVRAGLVLVPIPRNEKGPVAKDWNVRERCISDPEIAEYLDDNVGLAHAYSGTVCVDIDDMEKAKTWFAERDIDILALIDADDSVLISSGREGRAKLLYKGPTLPTFKLNQFGLELRCASRNGLTVQDVLPPSVHPDTGREYQWIGDWRNIPQVPEQLLALWQRMAKPDTRPPREKSEKRAELKELRQLVAKHDADGSYDDWIKVGMAIHYETGGSEDGFALWDEWSSAGSKYKGTSDLESHWRSFRLDDENLVTSASLRMDAAAELDEFQIITEEQIRMGEAREARPPVKSESMAQQLATIERDKSGTAFATLPNVLAVVSEPTICQWLIRFDEFKAEVMFAPVNDAKAWRPIRDTDYTAARIWLEQEALFYPVSKDIIRDTVHYIGEMNKMDSAQEWLASLTWDGVERIKDFMPKYMGTISGDYEKAVGVYLWTALAGRVMQPGCQVDMAPILVGRQGIGKSQGLKAIVPDPSFYLEVRLDEKDDEIARKMRGVLIGEIAELRGLRTADLDRIKAFMTRTHEKWTPKYMEHSASFARRLVMVGTTNEDDGFLVDQENRRWLPVRTAGVNVEAIKRDREQLWAEAFEMWLANGIQWQKAEQLGRTSRLEFQAEDNWQLAVETFLATEKRDCYPTADVLTQGIGLDQRTITHAHERRVSKIMRDLGYEKVNKRFGANVRKVWVSTKPVEVSIDDVLA